MIKTHLNILFNLKMNMQKNQLNLENTHNQNKLKKKNQKKKN